VDDIVELRTVVVTSSAVELFTSSEEIVICLLLSVKGGFSVVTSAKPKTSVGCVETFLELIVIIFKMVVFSGSLLVIIFVVLMFFFVTFLVTVVVVVFLGFFLKTASKQGFWPQQRITFLL